MTEVILYEYPKMYCMTQALGFVELVIVRNEMILEHHHKLLSVIIPSY